MSPRGGDRECPWLSGTGGEESEHAAGLELELLDAPPRDIRVEHERRAAILPEHGCNRPVERILCPVRAVERDRGAQELERPACKAAREQPRVAGSDLGQPDL